MKIIDLDKRVPSVPQLIRLAQKQNVLLKTAKGREFVLAELDDFAKEIAQVRRQKDLMRLLARRGRERATYSLEEVKRKLGLS